MKGVADKLLCTTILITGIMSPVRRGTGKTHLAVALGRESIRQNHSVQFVTAATLVAMLAEAHDDGSLEKQLTTLSRPKLLIIDELGYLPFEANAAICSSSWCREDRS